MSRDRGEHCGPLAPRMAGLAGGGGRCIHAEEIREARMNGNCNAMFSLLLGWRGREGGWVVSVRQGWGDRDAGNRKRHEKAQECRMPKLQQQLSPTPDAILIPLEAPGLGEANRIALADKRGPYCFF